MLGAAPTEAELELEFDQVLYGWRAGAAHRFDGGRRQDSVWWFERPKASRDHPTMKPVALVEKAIGNSSAVGDVVLDVFGGSGSTLIAAHLQRRVARLVELDPRYVDVICRRFQEFSGVMPMLEASGAAVDFLAESVKKLTDRATPTSAAS